MREFDVGFYEIFSDAVFVRLVRFFVAVLYKILAYPNARSCSGLLYVFLTYVKLLLSGVLSFLTSFLKFNLTHLVFIIILDDPEAEMLGEF